jgi:protein ImuA
MPPLGQNRRQIVELLKGRIERIETLEGAVDSPDGGDADGCDAGGKTTAAACRLSSGIPALDRLLPGGGLRRGTLIEWLAAGEGCGATTLALGLARAACREGGALVVVDRRGDFYPPAAAGLGIELDRLVLIRPVRAADDAWALDQALRCLGVRAVLAWPERLANRTFRRLQLAAAAGGGVGLLVRPLGALAEPSWAEARLLVHPLASQAGRRLRVEVVRCRGGAGGGTVELEIDDETGVVHLAAELAGAAAVRRAAGT